MKKLSVLILMILFRISYQYSYSFRTQSRLLATKKSVEQSCSVKSQEKHEIPYKLKEFSLLDVYGNDVSCSHNVSEKAFDGINMLSFSLIGDPQSLMRHRVSRSGFSYNPSLPKQSQFSQACSKFLPMSPVDFPLDVELNFFFQRPKSHYMSVKKERILKDNREKWCLKRQDVDNLVKFVLDALNGKMYVDDSQVCILKASKLYSDEDPYSQVIIKRILDN